MRYCLASRPMRAGLALAIALFVHAASVSAQTPAPSNSADGAIRLARIAALGRLWGEVKYFHPYLAYRPIDWDSAFVAAYPRVAAARSRDEYAAAVQRMLDALGDPATRVMRPRGQQPPPAAPRLKAQGPLTRWLDDSTLVVRLSALGDLADFPGVSVRLDSVGGLIDAARAVVLDLRGAAVAEDPQEEPDVAAYFHMGYYGSPFDAHLVDVPMTAPTHRARIYSGLPPQRGGSSGGYYAAFYAVDGIAIAPVPDARRRPLAAIVDERSSVPDAVLALAATGGIAVVAEGKSPSGAGSAAHTLELTDGVRVRVRTSEPADASGTLRADTTLAAGVPADAAVAAARALLRRQQSTSGATNRAAAPAPAAVARAEAPYAERAYPDSAHRVLAAYRFWTAINYFYPYKHLIGEDWDAVLPASIARLEQARDSTEYALAIVEMVRHIHDSHGFVQSRVLSQRIGRGRVPVRVRMIEGRPVITAVLDSTGARAGLRVGDEVLAVDGEDVGARHRRLDPPTAFSTPQAEADAKAGMLTRGPEGSTAVLVVQGGDGQRREVRVPRVPYSPAVFGAERSGPVLRLLPGNVGYADLARLTVPQVDSMFELFGGTQAIVFDMRGYPNGTAWAIAPRLADRPGKAAALFRRPLRDSPDTTMRTMVEFTQLIPRTDKPRYTGRTVMLIDERAASQAEHTGLFFEAANATKFIGTPTVGANGDVTNVVLPGDIVANFSGHDVRHADGRQLQRLGLRPDVDARPTIAGVRAGRDEVLEAALRFLGATPRAGTERQ